MQNFENSLQKLGLTPNEIKVYLYLINKGISLGNEIYKDNNLDKSSAYEAIANLINKKLLIKLGKSRNQQFQAVSTDRLYELYNAKLNDVKDIKISLDEMVNNIDSVLKESYKSKNITVIEGEDGFEKWAWSKLTVHKGELIREFVSFKLHSSFSKNYEDYSKQMASERLKKGINIRTLLNEEDIKFGFPNQNKSNPENLKEIRILPKDFEFKIEASLATYEDHLSLLRKKDGKFFGVILKDKFITDLINSMFDYIWSNSQKI